MKDRLALREDLLVFLKTAQAAVPSRDLAARFLAIPRADEETCRRLLAPILDGVRGLEHRPGSGWLFAGPAAGARPPVSDGPADLTADAGLAPAPAGPDAAPPVPVEAGDDPEPLARLDFVALAVDGIGPGGSGVPRAVAIAPVVGGETLPEECFPAGGLDEDGLWVGDDGDAEAGAPRRGAALSSVDLEAIAETVGDLPIVAHRVGKEVEPLRRAAALAGLPFHPRVISAARLGHLLAGLKANHPIQELAVFFGVTADGPDDCRGRARLLARAWPALVAALAGHGVTTLEGLLEFQETAAPAIDFAPYAFTAEDLRLLPAAPGVYRFLDATGSTIYIGKAKNLRARVGSYFVPSARRTPKGRAILAQARRLEIELAASELEAILLEADLLLRDRPPLNRQFEVSERPAPYGPRQNLVVVLRDAGGETCTTHLLRAGRYLRRLPCGGDADSAWETIDAAVRDAYFPAPAQDEGGAIDWFLLCSYVRRHADEVNVLDIDECAGADEALQRLRVLHRAARTGAGRVLAR